ARRGRKAMGPGIARIPRGCQVTEGMAGHRFGQRCTEPGLCYLLNLERRFTMNWLRVLAGRSSSQVSQTGHTPRARLMVEALESRVVAYATSGNLWSNPQLLTLSFMPDGTNLGGVTSNLFATFNARFGSTSTWQNQILKAAQQWAQQTNLNFA